MEIEVWVKKMKELYTHILSFLESENDSEEAYQALTKIIDDQEVVKKEESVKEIFRLLYNIGDNHHRSSELFNRLVRIIKYLQKEVLPIKQAEIIDIYKKNKRLLLLLFEHKIVAPDESFVNYLIEDYHCEEQQLCYYFFSEIKDFLDEEKIKSIENGINQEFKENIDTFISKIKEGSNNSPICKMIREDSIEEFISFVNQTNLSLTSKIKADFYESNSFLISNEASLLEYAFFYGSIQIIKYLINNHVLFPKIIWQYAIHSNNPEMIEYLEENNVQYDKRSVSESIKCHHNDIANYIIDDIINKSHYDFFHDSINLAVFDFCNYYFIQKI